MDPSHLIVTSFPDPRPLRATLQSSFHRILKVLHVKADDPDAGFLSALVASCRRTPPVRGSVPLNRTPKILGVTLDTHFTFSLLARDCVESLEDPQRHETLAGSNWGFTTWILVASYKTYVRPILNYATSIWFTLVSSMHLDKLDVIHNKALMIVSGCHLKAATSHFRVETGVLPLRVHLELCSQQFHASAPPSNQWTPVTSSSPPSPTPAPSGPPSSPHFIASSKSCMSELTTPTPASCQLWWRPVGGHISLGHMPPTRPDDRGDRPVSGAQQVLWAVRPPVDPVKQLLLRSYRYALFQLRSGYCSRLMSYRHSVFWADNPMCTFPDCHNHWAHGAPPLQLSYTSHGSGPCRGKEDGIPPGSLIPPRPSAVFRPAHFTGRLWLVPPLTLVFPLNWISWKFKIKQYFKNFTLFTLDIISIISFLSS